MKQVLINSVLLLVFSGFLLAPNYPYLHWFLTKSRISISNAGISAENHKTLVGDIAYLSAIMSRAADKAAKTKKRTPPPEPNNNLNHLVYITPSNLELPQPGDLVCKHENFINQFLSTVYLKIPSPPPQS